MKIIFLRNGFEEVILTFLFLFPWKRSKNSPDRNMLAPNDILRKFVGKCRKML